MVAHFQCSREETPKDTNDGVVGPKVSRSKKCWVFCKNDLRDGFLLSSGLLLENPLSRFDDDDTVPRRWIAVMAVRSIKVLFLVLLELCCILILWPFHVTLVDGRAATIRPFLRLYVGQSLIHNGTPGEKGKGGLSNVALVQFHALCDVEICPIAFSADGNSESNEPLLSDSDTFCFLVAKTILDIVRTHTERRIDEEDEVGALLRMVPHWESFEEMRTICRHELAFQTSGIFFSFVYFKTTTTYNTAHLVRPPPPYNVSRRYSKAYGYNPDKGVVEELPSNDALNEHFRLFETKTSSGPFDGRYWNVHLETKLLPSGGMHRDLHHTLYFSVDETSNAPISSNETYNGTIDLLLHLPSGLFINIEDCFHWRNDPQNRFQIDHISTVSATLIDQEEPAFVSPSHLLRIQVEFSLFFSRTSAISEGHVAHQGSLEFSTQLHARYPKPLSPQEIQNFQLITIPPLILISGNLSTGIMDLDWVPYRDKEDPEWLMWWVAPGHQRHFSYVLGVTIAAAVLGAILMWRDLSQISVWD
jgi:hypothetical protein